MMQQFYFWYMSKANESVSCRYLQLKHIITLVTVAQSWNQIKYSPVNKEIMTQTYKIMLLDGKKGEILPFATT